MPTSPYKDWNIFVQCLRIQWITLGEYKENFFFDFFSRAVGFVLFWLTWETILGNTSIPGWNLNGLLIFAGMQQIFLSIILMFAYGAHFINDAIVRGWLDNYLARPCHEWFVVSMQNGFMAFAGFTIGVLILALGWWNGLFALDAIKLILIVLSFLIGMGIAYSFGLIISSFSFWLGKNDLFERMFWGVFEFDFYPTNIFPAAIQIMISFTVPFMLVQTVPSLLLLNQISIFEAVKWLGVSIIILLANFIVFRTIWKAGLKRYESMGG